MCVHLFGKDLRLQGHLGTNTALMELINSLSHSSIWWVLMEHERMLGVVLGMVNRRTALAMRLPSSSSSFTGTTVVFGLHLE